MESAVDYWTARALLEWQVEMGADEAILDAPVDRFAAVAEAAAAQPVAASNAQLPKGPPPVPAPIEVDPVAEAAKIAGTVTSLDQLRQALSEFDHCKLKSGARNLVFGDGNPAARVMIIGEAPGREEDGEGRPFIGQAGQMLDRMLAAIGLDRSSPDPARSVYITNVMPWRPVADRTPEPADVAMMVPFVQAHIRLIDPDFIVLMGNTSCQALLGQTGVTRLRGTWAKVLDKPALPMLHPAYLLRQTSAKREAWADLLSLKSQLRSR